MSWLRRMNLAVEYIEENLNGEIDIEDVSEIACCSKYHFHRVFFSYFNVTFSEYIRRRKFTLAAVDVISGQGNIMDIALKYGYKSPNAFTRAFRGIHGVNPNEARLSQVKIATYNRATFPSEAIGVEKMNYKIVERPSFKVFGKSKTFNLMSLLKTARHTGKSMLDQMSTKHSVN